MRNPFLIWSGIVLMWSATVEAQTINVTLPYAYVGIPITGIGISGGCSISGTSTNSNPSVATLDPSTFTNVPTPVNPGPGDGEFTINPLSPGTTQIVITYTINAASCPYPPEDSGGTLTYTVIVVPSGGAPPPTTTTAPLTTANFLNTGFVIDPVSTATGEIAGQDEAADLTLGGPTSFEFRRYYASFLSAGGVSSALGTNWMHNFDTSLAVSGTSATVTLFRGKTVTFSQSNNTFTLSSNEQRPYQLAAVSGGGYQFLDPRSNRIYNFSSAGSLGSIQDRNGNTITITQGPNGPTLASDGLGRTLTFTYTDSSLAKIQDQSGRTVTYQYSGGVLSSWTDANGNQTTFAYNSSGGLSGLMTSETRPAGNQPLTQTFDSKGRVSTQSDSFSNTTTLAYSAGSGGATAGATAGVGVTEANDSNMNLTSLSDSSGVASSFAYDSNNRPTSTTDRLGNQSTASWDAASGLPASYTDELGNSTSYTYAASTIGPFTFHDLGAVSFADGTTVSLMRDSKGNVISLTDQAGNLWQSTYTSNGWPATLTNPSGGVYTFSYNADGMRASLQLPSSDTTKFGYDSVKRLNLITNPDSTAKTFQYDAVSNPLKATDERSNSVSASFDANNNTKTLTDALAATTNFAFDTDDRPTSTTDPLKNAVTASWDTQSRLKSLTNAAGNSIVYTYDNLNRVTAVADASGNGFSYGLDEEARPTSITDGLSRTVRYTRDAHGSIVRVATPKNENFSFTFDALNRLASSTDPLGRTAQYSRDPRGILSAAVLPGGVGVSFGLNGLGLATSVTDPVDNVWTRAFDNMGRLTSKTDPLNRTSSFTYDSRQRLSTTTFPIGTAQYSYDATGNLTALKYSDGTSLSYTWDADNRLTAATGISLAYDADGRIANSNGLAITRDAAGRIASVTYAAGKTVNYTYNSRGLPGQVTDWVGGNTTFTYDAAGELTTMAFANGVTQTYTWDADGRLLTLTASNGGTTLSSISLTRDALGRVISAARSSANIPSEARGTQSMAYDAAAQTLGDTFDGLGRATQDTQRTYTWDLASRLSSYTGSDGSASFTYDASAQRLSRTSSGVTQNYVWNYAFPLPVLATVQSGGSDQTYYIWLPDGTLLNSITASNNTRRFYHFDESGSAVLLTDSTGAVTDTYAISIYGDAVTQTGSTVNPFTWQGKFGVMSEGSTSIYYMRARYYDSGPVRFLSRDPLSSGDPREINPYQFVHANPVEHSDATGKDEDFLIFLEALGFRTEDLEYDEIVQKKDEDERKFYEDERKRRAASVTDSVLNLSVSNPDDVFVPTDFAPDLSTPAEKATAPYTIQPICLAEPVAGYLHGYTCLTSWPTINSTSDAGATAKIPGIDWPDTTASPSAPPARTTPLFPSVINAAGFDTGLAIGNAGTPAASPESPAAPYNPLKLPVITPSLQKAIATAPPDEVL